MYSQPQSRVKINAALDDVSKAINIQQDIYFTNHSKDTLSHLYLLDWNYAYNNKNTELATRFAEEFNRSLHLAKPGTRSETNIFAVIDKDFRSLNWVRQKNGDIIKVQLEKAILPGETCFVKLAYRVKLPSDEFTGYGYSENGYDLRYWYIAPAVYDGTWKKFSNKNLDDFYTEARSAEITFMYPNRYKLVTDMEVLETRDEYVNLKKTELIAENLADFKLVLTQSNRFFTYQNDKITLISDIEVKNITDISKAISADRVLMFIDENLGSYPHPKLLVTDNEYRRNPLYGLNQLPNFLRPFPDEFQFEMKLLKTALNNYLENTIFINPREEKWVTDAIQTYLMMQYVEEFYPDMRLTGNLSRIWGFRPYYLARMKFNDQYEFFHLLMARKNLDQSLTTSRDSLIKFNEKIANKYKAGLGLKYLSNYLGQHYIDEKIKEYYYLWTSTSSNLPSFEDILKKGATKNIDWFFDEYISTRKKIDFKISKIIKSEDSVAVTIKNKRGTNVPITLFGINKKDSIISQYWLEDIDSVKTFTISNKKGELKRLVLNYDKVIPEFNQRDNWKATNGFFSSNKKFKFQFFKDAEDPYYNQMFWVPVATFNIYDGFTPGIRIYNKTFLERPFVYDISPSYGLTGKEFVGSGSLLYRKYFENSSLFVGNVFLSGSTFHYAPDLRFTTITPGISLGFRNNDLRSNARHSLSLRYVNVLRELDPSVETDPNYSVLNARYSFSNDGIIDYVAWFADAQAGNNFSKVAVNFEFRKLYPNNRQFNFRFYGGLFLSNNTDTDFFSFALDRPTDYLFDFNYLGRSEGSGIYSQQLIIAEGGFKSKLPDPFANRWMTTINTSTSIWRWIEAYGDIGLMKSNDTGTRFVYGSGIRLNLVTDYFELYFPVYSNNGWEIDDLSYSQKIRFIVTLSPRTLTGLFTRKWF